MVDTVTTTCWPGTSTTAWSVVSISRTAAAAATTTALRPRKNACHSVCGLLNEVTKRHLSSHIVTVIISRSRTINIFCISRITKFFENWKFFAHM